MLVLEDQVLVLNDSSGSAETDDFVISQMKTRLGNKQLELTLIHCLLSRSFTRFRTSAKTDIEDKVCTYHS